MAQGDKDDPRNCPKCGHFNGPLHEYDCPAGSYGPKLPSLDDLHAMGLTMPSANDPDPTPAADGECWCERCRPNTPFASRFIVCPTCGNKRCPRATYHGNACTGSNEPGQAGSSWEHCPKAPMATPVADGGARPRETTVDELERLALKATPGPWDIVYDTNVRGTRRDVGYKTVIANAGTFSSNGCDVTTENRANAAFMAAANPAAVLALIANLRAAERDVDAARDAVFQLACRAKAAERDRDAVVAERDALRRAVEGLPEIVRRCGDPGPGGIDITGGIPSEIYVGIGREHYADADGDYELARDVAASVREECARAVERALAPAAPPGDAGTGQGEGK